MSFKAARKKAGYSMAKAANAIGVSKASVSYWENGICLPSAENLMKLAKLYGCSIDDLLRKEE